MSVPPRDPALRFWPRVDKSDSCWLWTGARFRGGYGCFRVDPRSNSTNAHRAAWIITHGDPGHMSVLHRCDNRLCVNPDHLFLGTTQDNTRDRHEKARDARGSRHGCARLTESDVERIISMHRDGLSCREIARLFTVSSTHVWRIATRRNWKHMEV